LPWALHLLASKTKIIHANLSGTLPPPRDRSHVASFSGSIPQAAFPSGLAALPRHVSGDLRPSPASERRPWDASLAAAASSSSPWSDLYGSVSTCTLPSKPYRACCHSPLGLPAEPALLFSTSCCLHQLVVCQGLRGGGIESSKVDRTVGGALSLVLLHVILDEPQ
jgi:hypothetical protein